jgi:hypothetical protein
VYAYNSGVCGLNALYHLRAISGAGVSAPLSTPAVTLPCQPQLSALASSTSVYLSWADVAGETGYTVEMWNGSNFEAAYQGSLPAGSTHFLLGGQLPQTSLRLRIKAQNAAGSITSAEILVTTKKYDFFAPMLMR